MILIAFENNVFPFPKQNPSENIHDWKEDEVDSTHIIPEKPDELLPSVKRRKRKTEKERALENIDKGEYNTYDELDNLLFKTRRYLDLNLIKNHFNYSTLEKMLESLENTKKVD